MLKQCLYILFFLFCVCCLNSYSQNKDFAREEFEFVRYLIGNGMKEEALTWAKKDLFAVNYDLKSLDSISFLKGWAFYSSKSLDEASFCFDKVKDSSAFKPAALFFSSLCMAYSNEFNKAKNNLLSNESLLYSHKELYSFELAGYSLLQRDFVSYKKCQQNFTYNSYSLFNGEKTLDSVYSLLENKKAKSPFLAATLSAIIPGAGKIYAGSFGEGISSFITVGSFIGICAENWIKHGFSNWKTLLFGALSSVFYVGNIYGSYFSVKISENEFNNNQNLSILYNIHIPLRNTFGL